MATGEGFAYLDQIPTTEEDLISLGLLPKPPEPFYPSRTDTHPLTGSYQSSGDGDGDDDGSGGGGGGGGTISTGGVAPIADAISDEPVTSSSPYEGWMAGADNVLDEFADMNAITDAENALEIIKEKLREYGLEGLADEAYEMLLDGVSPEVVVLRLRDTEEFAARFPGLQMRRDNNMSAISPSEYISLERQYRQVMMTAGIPEGFYDSVDDFAEFIGNDVSPAEMNERVALAVTAVDSIDPNLKGQLRDLYGIGVENDGELIAYYLDPQRGTDIIEQRLQLEAAGLSAASVSTLGSGFNQQTSERLVDLNIQKREIAERFRGQRAITQQLVGEDEFTSSEFAAAEFGLDSDAVADLAQLRGQRSQRGVRQSGALVTRSGAVGLGSAT